MERRTSGETQRHWSDLAIARTTPTRLGLFSLVTVWMHGLFETRGTTIRPRTAGWYGKIYGCPGMTRKPSKSPPVAFED